MGEVRIALLGGFECIHGGERSQLPLGAQRLLALLALHNHGLHRCTAGERLWPDSTPRRAAANLRSALWRGRQVGVASVIHPVGSRLVLSPTVTVDLWDVVEKVRSARLAGNLFGNADWEALVDVLSQELLPNWSDDWIIVERERWDHFRLQTMEQLSEHLKTAEQFAPALQTALAATAIEPLRESVHRLIVRVHLEEGNPASAFKHYQRYRKLLQRELGVNPSDKMYQLVRHMMSE